MVVEVVQLQAPGVVLAPEPAFPWKGGMPLSTQMPAPVKAVRYFAPWRRGAASMIASWLTGETYSRLRDGIQQV